MLKIFEDKFNIIVFMQVIFKATLLCHSRRYCVNQPRQCVGDMAPTLQPSKGNSDEFPNMK